MPSHNSNIYKIIVYEGSSGGASILTQIHNLGKYLKLIKLLVVEPVSQRQLAPYQSLYNIQDDTFLVAPDGQVISSAGIIDFLQYAAASVPSVRQPITQGKVGAPRVAPDQTISDDPFDQGSRKEGGGPSGDERIDPNANTSRDMDQVRRSFPRPTGGEEPGDRPFKPTTPPPTPSPVLGDNIGRSISDYFQHVGINPTGSDTTAATQKTSRRSN
jgi:hypothetical protein